MTPTCRAAFRTFGPSSAQTPGVSRRSANERRYNEVMCFRLAESSGNAEPACISFNTDFSAASTDGFFRFACGTASLLVTLRDRIRYSIIAAVDSPLRRSSLAALAAIFIGAAPPFPVMQDGNPHASMSSVTRPLKVRPSPAPEREPPFDARAQSGDNIRTIIGPTDDRTQVNPEAFPPRAVVAIVGGMAACSGWLYGPDVVATAGHCLYEKGRWAAKLKVHGAGPRGKDVKECGARALFTSRGWTRGEERYDYGAIKLDCEMGTDRGWLGYSWGLHARARAKTRMIGFRLDDRAQSVLQADEQTIAAIADGQVFYAHDTGAGTSGAPVIALGACPGCAVAVHTTGAHSGPAPHDTMNHGTLISREVFENLRAWKESR